MKEDHLLAVGPPFPFVQASPTYSFGFMPPWLVDLLIKPGRFESPVHGSNTQVCWVLTLEYLVEKGHKSVYRDVIFLSWKMLIYHARAPDVAAYAWTDVNLSEHSVTTVQHLFSGNH